MPLQLTDIILVEDNERTKDMSYIIICYASSRICQQSHPNRCLIHPRLLAFAVFFYPTVMHHDKNKI
jgi:hypothetical protein